MAFVGGSQADGQTFERIGDESRFDPTRLDGERLFRLLHERVLEEGRETA